MDRVLIGGDFSAIRRFSFAIIAGFLLNLVCRFINGYLVRTAANSVVERLRNDLYERLMSLSVGYFHEHKQGEQVSHVINDVQALGRVVTSVIDVVKDPILFLALLAYAFYLNWRLALVTMAVIPFLVLLLAKSGKSSKRYSNRIFTALSDMSAAVAEAVTGIRVIQAFGLEPYLKRRFQRVNRDFTRAALKAIRLESISGPGAELLVGLVMTGLISYAGHEAIAGRMSAGDVLAFFSCFGMMPGPLKSINDVNIAVHQSHAALENVFSALELRSDIQSPAGGGRELQFHDSLEFSSVSFSYPQQKTGGLENVSFRVKKGETVALVGPSGAGKSTLLGLALRFFDPRAGRVLIDGVDLRDYSLSSLRDQISLVTQDVFLFHDTIAANIRGAKRGATEAEVKEAAQAANAWEFIAQFPDGLQTIVGDRGQKLSGGERQRISIARAILNNTPILLLDEATSALDSASERLVQESLDRLAAGRTVIVVAHRLSTIRRANRVVVLEQGRVLEEGPHDQLLAKGGAYARALRLQAH